MDVGVQMQERVASVVRIDDTCQIIVGNSKLDLAHVGFTFSLFCPFKNINPVLLLTVPVSVATAERCFGKTFNRSTMTD